MSWQYRIAWPREFRKRMFRGGAVFCAYCFEELFPETATVDHVIPKQFGGANRVSNYLMSCAPCNQQRGKETWKLKQNRAPKNCFQCLLLHKGPCPLSKEFGKNNVMH